MEKLIFFIILCVLAGCNGKVRNNSGTLPRIDMEEEYPKREINLYDIGEVEYIPLETRSDVLLSANSLEQICVSDSLIVTRSNAFVFIFNRQGKFIRSFNHSGRGPEEYNRFNNLAVDFMRREIYINDGGKICVYDLEGAFKRILKLPGWISYHIFSYDRDNLLGCFSNTSSTAAYTTGEVDKQPYWLINKDNGEMQPLALTFQERVLSAALIQEPGATTFMVWPLNTIVKNGDEFLIADYGTDTVYSLSGTTLTPCLLKTPVRTWKKEPPIVSYVEFKTNRYVGVKFMELAWGKSFFRRLLSDLSTGEVFEYEFMNHDFQPARKVFFSLGMGECDLPSGYLRYKLLTTDLKNAYEAGQLTGKLKELAGTLGEDDNPVLILVKLRE